MLSSNAPFNEFGQSMILRDIEQLYLSLNNAGRGSAGDGGTQDQATVADQNTGDSGGLPDLSGLATTDYVDAAIAAIPDVSYPISIANGGTNATTLTQARTNLAINALTTSASGFEYSGAEATYTVPSLCRRLTIFMLGAGGGGGGNDSSTTGYFKSSSYLGAADTSIYSTRYGGGGGSGCMVMLTVDTVGGEVITYKVGNRGSSGVAGQPTYIRISTNYIYAGGGSAGLAYTNPLGGAGGVLSTAGSGLSLFTNTFVHYAISSAGGNGWTTDETSAGNGASGGSVCGFAYPIFGPLYSYNSGSGGYSNASGSYGFIAFIPHAY